MSEEEIKAIEHIKNIKKWWWNNSPDRAYCINGTDMEQFDVLLNYIDKLQKENEELQEENKELKKMRNLDNELLKNIVTIEKNYISKDKIKEALGDKNIPDEMILTYIETLVSENSRLEDIEDRKVQIEYNKVFNKGVKSVEDKIKTEIKELEEILEKRKTIDIVEEINRLDELLGE